MTGASVEPPPGQASLTFLTNNNSKQVLKNIFVLLNLDFQPRKHSSRRSVWMNLDRRVALRSVYLPLLHLVITAAPFAQQFLTRRCNITSWANVVKDIWRLVISLDPIQWIAHFSFHLLVKTEAEQLRANMSELWTLHGMENNETQTASQRLHSHTVSLDAQLWLTCSAVVESVCCLIGESQI